MALLNRATRSQLMDALQAMSVLDSSAGRTLLLQDLPAGLRNTLARADAKIIDLANIVAACDQWDPDPSSGQEHPLRILIENARGLVAGTATAQNLQAILDALPGAQPPTSPAPVPPLAATTTPRVDEIKAAFGALLATLDEVGNPELLDKARQLRSALAQDEPDLEFIVELRRYFAARPGKARAAAAAFFATPSIRQIIDAATQREYGAS
jgi:hypothetical protein